jgi:hypothetical protein
VFHVLKIAIATLKFATISTFVVSAALCVAQNGDMTGATQSSTHGGNAQSSTQSTTRSDRTSPNPDGKTGGSVNNTVIPADQQTRPSFTPDQAGDNAAGGGEIPSGSTIVASLDLLLSSKTSQIGDHFTASIVKPVKALDGTVLIPSGTKLEGVVTNVDQSQLESSLVPGDSRVEFRFNRMVLPNGAAAPINLTLDSVKASDQKAQRDPNQDAGEGSKTGSSLAEAAPRDDQAAASVAQANGVSVGAMPGGGYVLASEAGVVDLPPQTQLVLRVQHNTMVPASGLR